MNKSVVLPCHVTGVPFPAVEWLHDRVSIDESLSSKYRLFSNGSLRIFHLKKSDSGVYRCIASNEGGKDSLDVSLDVHCKSRTAVNYTEKDR